MPKGAKFGGRQKGQPNKITAGARHAIFEVFDAIGGPQALGEWAKENRNEFYKLWGKTIPQHNQVTGLNGLPIQVQDIPASDLDILNHWKGKK